MRAGKEVGGVGETVAAAAEEEGEAESLCTTKASRASLKSCESRIVRAVSDVHSGRATDRACRMLAIACQGCGIRRKGLSMQYEHA